VDSVLWAGHTPAHSIPTAEDRDRSADNMGGGILPADNMVDILPDMAAVDKGVALAVVAVEKAGKGAAAVAEHLS